MSNYFSSIKKLNADLLVFINRYEKLDEKDPITNPLLKVLKKHVNALNTISMQHAARLNRHLTVFEKSFQKIYQRYKLDKENITNHLNTSLEVINSKYTKKVNLLNEEINKLKETSEKKLEEYTNDIGYFFITSNQQSEVFDDEYQENIKRYEYQISAAKETYNQSIKIHNIKLDGELKELNAIHKNSFKGFDANTDQLIERLNERILKCNEELKEVSDKLNNVRIQMKERLRQESVNLNNEIKVLVDEKNKSIVTARTKYSKSQSTSSMEKENKRQEYQIDGQKILKDFVYSITELDEYSSNYKTKYNKTIEDENRKYQYMLLDMYKKQNAELAEIIDKGMKINHDYDKYTKRLIKDKNKQYYKTKNHYQKIQDKQLLNYELLYQKEMENIRHNKTLLELDKNFSIKNINEKEQTDNKYYQELNSIYENDMNLLIQLANLKYNQKANLVKCQSRIRNKGFEKDLDISEANFQKKIEKIQTNINKFKFEIEGALELKKIVTDYENGKYKKNVNHLSVLTLLEIEKCKVLDQFNHRQYENNILNSQTNLEYSRKKLEIENQEFEVLTNIKIERVKATLQRDTVNAAFKIKEDQIYESEDKSIQNRNTLYELDSISHTVLYERFKLEMKIIHQILSTFISLVREMEIFSSKILKTFFKSISIRPEYLDIIKVFVFDFFKILCDYYSNLLNNLKDEECEIIYKRIEFEEGFKFKTYYKEITTNYDIDRNRLLTKKKSILDTLENYNNTMETFKSRVYNLQNQNNLIRQRKYSTHSSTQKEIYNKEISANKQKITDLKKKISDITKLKAILEKDDSSLDNELKVLEREFIIREDKIKQMQYNSAISFYDLRRNLSRYIEIASYKFKDLNSDTRILPIRFFNIQNSINGYNNKIHRFNSTIIKDLFKITHIFYSDTYKSIQKDKRLLLIKFKSDIDYIYSKTTHLIEDNRKEYDKKVSIHIQELKAIDTKYKNEEKRFASILQNNDKQYEDAIHDILKEKRESLSRFYVEYYAMCDNLEGIKYTYDIEMQNYENQFQMDKLNLTNHILSEKSDLANNLDNFIKAKEELINHLPAATKFQSQLLHKETRDLNAGLSQEIKNVRLKFNLERKNIQRNITSIQQSLEQSRLDNEIRHQKSIIKEKRNHANLLKRIENDLNVSTN